MFAGNEYHVTCEWQLREIICRNGCFKVDFLLQVQEEHQGSVYRPSDHVHQDSADPLQTNHQVLFMSNEVVICVHFHTLNKYVEHRCSYWGCSQTTITKCSRMRLSSFSPHHVTCSSLQKYKVNLLLMKVA